MQIVDGHQEGERGPMGVKQRVLRGVATAIAAVSISMTIFPETAGASNQSLCCDGTVNFGSGMNTGTGTLLIMQTDGNLVQYVGGVAQWHTNTVGQSGDFLKMQSDGNAVLYTAGSSWLWQTGTDLYPGAALVLQDDGNLVVYASGGVAVWARSWTKDANGSRTYAQKQFPRYGWSVATEYPCLNNLWNHESNWQWNATNPSSGAYGIPQSLPANKMAGAGTNWLYDGLTQIQWGLYYIRYNNITRFTTPCQAWTWWQAHGFY